MGASGSKPVPWLWSFSCLNGFRVYIGVYGLQGFGNSGLGFRCLGGFKCLRVKGLGI